jgi:hypothetical protein
MIVLKTTVRTELTRGLKFRSNAVVASEVMKKSGVCKIESCKTFESSERSFPCALRLDLIGSATTQFTGAHVT